ncbi:MAG: protease inhibitor I42 family protein [Nocardioidaceae bacterium]|nr:protease inhibitor I42 family protein [Nocardioidaceae bacterium]
MSGEHVVEAGDDGRALIRLREPGSTGYEWVLVDLPEPLRLVTNRYEADAVPGDDVVDSGGQHIFASPCPSRARTSCGSRCGWPGRPCRWTPKRYGSFATDEFRLATPARASSSAPDTRVGAGTA